MMSVSKSTMKAVKSMAFAVALSSVAGVAMAATAPAPGTSQAPALKIGVLDMQQIMQKSPQVAALNKQLQAEFQPRQQKIVSAEKELQDEMAKLSKNAAVMSATEKTKQQDKIIAGRAAYQGMVQSYQQDLANAQSQSMQKFMGELQGAVDSVAKKDGYTIILQHAAAPYAAPGLDVTEEVIKAMPGK